MVKGGLILPFCFFPQMINVKCSNEGKKTPLISQNFWQKLWVFRGVCKKINNYEKERSSHIINIW